MGAVHGIENWDNIETYNVEFGDDFYGLAGKFGYPFKENEILLSLNFVPTLLFEISLSSYLLQRTIRNTKIMMD